MLIYGAWLSARSWDPFAEYFRDRGYDVSAPEWPRKQGDVEELREATDAIAGLGLTEIVDHYEAKIRALEHEPILIAPSLPLSPMFDRSDSRQSRSDGFDWLRGGGCLACRRGAARRRVVSLQALTVL